MQSWRKNMDDYKYFTDEPGKHIDNYRQERNYGFKGEREEYQAYKDMQWQDDMTSKLNNITTIVFILLILIIVILLTILPVSIRSLVPQK